MKYRKDIDGLRAISIIAVILFHSEIILGNFLFFSNGFLGVDIFFVISGYLITGILYNNKDKNLSLTNFFESRVRRIIPLYLFVILITIFLAAYSTFPQELEIYLNSVLYSFFFISNFFFYFQSFDYFNNSINEFNFLLHTWSLSAEMQFYLIFPFLFLILLKYVNKKLIFIILLIVINIVSIKYFNILEAYGEKYYLKIPTNFFNFYFITYRFWEFFFGSFIFFLEKKNLRINFKNTDKYILNLCFIIILISLIIPKNQIIDTFTLTLICVFSSGSIIYFSNKKTITTQILNSKYLVFLGLISYSLYLWHFPIFKFFDIQNYGSYFNSKFFQIFVTFLISIATYYSIERIFRNSIIISKSILLIFILTLYFLIISLSLYFYNEKDNLNSFPEILKKDILSNSLSFSDSSGNKCFKSECIFNSNSKKKFLLIGDSQIATLASNLVPKLVNLDYRVETYLLDGCLYLPNYSKFTLINRQYIKHECDSNYQNKLRDKIFNGKNNIILLGGRMPLYLSRDFFNNEQGDIENGVDFIFKDSSGNHNFDYAFVRSINEILEKKHKIILLYPIPEVGFHVPKEILKLVKKTPLNKLNEKLENNPLTTKYSVFVKRTQPTFDLYDSIKSEYLYRVYPHKILCNKNGNKICETHDKKNVYYFDEHHPSFKGAELISDLIIKEMEKNNLN